MVVDILVIIILLISAGIAFLRGFIRELLTIAGVLGGLIAAYVFAPGLIPKVESWLGIKEGEDMPRLFDVVPYDLLAKVLTYGGIFIIVVIVLSIVSHMLAESARKIGLGAVDRTLGVMFGIVRGIVLLGVLYLPFYALAEKETRETWFKGSHTHFYIEKTAMILSTFLPEEAAESLKDEEPDIRNVLDNVGAIGVPSVLKTDEDGNGTKINQGDETQQEEQNSANPALSRDQPAGYSREFRQDMDALFEDNAPE